MGFRLVKFRYSEKAETFVLSDGPSGFYVLISYVMIENILYGHKNLIS